jgi:hypothetical protein
MRTLSVIVVVVGLAVGACAALSPQSSDNEFFLDVYWAVARECEAQYRHLHVDRIAPDGGLSLSADADSRIGAAGFRECYWTGVPARVERRRAAGLPVPQDANLHPDIDID